LDCTDCCGFSLFQVAAKIFLLFFRVWDPHSDSSAFGFILGLNGFIDAVSPYIIALDDDDYTASIGGSIFYREWFYIIYIILFTYRKRETNGGKRI